MSRFVGFEPVWDGESILLILGSFPSVKSREEGFYYGNPRNRFWGMLFGFFGEDVPAEIEKKREFLHRRRIALWDVYASCEVVGSSDASIREGETADLPRILSASKVQRVFCNGSKAYEGLSLRFPELLPIARRLPSTSPANPRYREEVWHAALFEVFPEERKGRNA